MNFSEIHVLIGRPLDKHIRADKEQPRKKDKDAKTTKTITKSMSIFINRPRPQTGRSESGRCRSHRCGAGYGLFPPTRTRIPNLPSPGQKAHMAFAAGYCPRPMLPPPISLIKSPGASHQIMQPVMATALAARAVGNESTEAKKERAAAWGAWDSVHTKPVTARFLLFEVQVIDIQIDAVTSVRPWMDGWLSDGVPGAKRTTLLLACQACTEIKASDNFSYRIAGRVSR